MLAENSHCAANYLNPFSPRLIEWSILSQKLSNLSGSLNDLWLNSCGRSSLNWLDCCRYRLSGCTLEMKSHRMWTATRLDSQFRRFDYQTWRKFSITREQILTISLRWSNDQPFSKTLELKWSPQWFMTQLEWEVIIEFGLIAVVIA